MNRFRIGTDKRIQWRIKNEITLEGRMLALSLSVGFSKMFILNFTVLGKVVEFDYLGIDQKATGVVTLTLYENLGLGGMRALDTVAFEIMAYSWMVGEEDTEPSEGISIFPIYDSGQVDPDSGGSTGFRGVEVTVDGSSGTPHCDAEIVGGVLHLAFSGLKGSTTNDFTDEDKSKLDSALQSEDLVPITEKIPAQASAQNQLADKAFVNSSIATAAAEFKGTHNSLASLQQVTADNNDYGYVVSTDQSGNTVYNRYKYNGSEWVFEYSLNNSSYTAAEWAAIQSQITAALVQKLAALPTSQELNAMISGAQGSTFDEVSVSIDNNHGTPSGTAAIVGRLLQLAFHNLKGDPGQSAYALAVALGYTGTEQEWIASLHGTNGVGFDDMSTPVVTDGTFSFTLSNGDQITVDLNHQHPQYYSKLVETSQPQGGFLPDVIYKLGTLTGSVTFALAAAVTGNANHYFIVFDTGSTAPTIVWPSGLTWVDGSAPSPSANKHCEVSIMDGIAAYLEV